MNTKALEAFHFFRAWLAEPLRVAAVAPSGRALAKIMTAEISPQSGPVIELGPGTGAFTRTLIQRGVSEEDLVLVYRRHADGSRGRWSKAGSSTPTAS